MGAAEERAEVHLILNENGYYNMVVTNANCEVFYYENLTQKEIGAKLIQSMGLSLV